MSSHLFDAAVLAGRWIVKIVDEVTYAEPELAARIFEGEIVRVHMTYDPNYSRRVPWIIGIELPPIEPTNVLSSPR
jgi:hypothetical protein